MSSSLVGMPTYEAYKDSGVEWLGDVPEHWELTRLGTRFEERRTKVSDKDYPPLSVTKNGVLPQLETAAKTNDGDNRKLVMSGDFVINSRSDRKGSSGISDRDGSVSLINIVLEPKEINPQFCNYLLKSYNFIEEFYRMGHGIVADLWTTRYDEMKAVIMAIPHLHEQTAIAAFLDRKTAQIDQAVAIKEQQIALLKERKQILIQNAVTRGLTNSPGANLNAAGGPKGEGRDSPSNPDAPLRESGVDWIGEVPVHWAVERFKYLFAQSRLEPRKGDGVVTSYRDGQVTLRSNRRLEGYTEAILEQGYQGVRVGQLVLNSMDAFEGAIGVSDSEGKCTPEYVVCDPVSEDYQPEYFALLLREMALARYIQVICNAVRQRAVRIRYNNLAQRFLVVPPREEQAAIVKHIEIESAKIDKAIDLQQQQIDRLKEYKATLINSAVTGKIKVPQPSEDKAA